jgi:exodeoxyribonuclease III
MKLISYNVNGIRAAMTKNLTGWLAQSKPDVLCLQEIKAMPGQFDTFLFETEGYHCNWYPAQKKGYSGVAILSKQKPDNVVMGMGNSRYDDEGRVLRADFGDTSFISLYLPSGTSGDERQQFKMEFCGHFYDYIQNLLTERPNLVISGDINICHHPIDIHDPIGNKKSSGFLPDEREWLGRFLDMGFVDSFRHKYPEAVKYSWWTQRFGPRIRQENKGWRIDYSLVSHAMKDKIEDADYLNDAWHSDHCPVLLELAVSSNQ